jgi:hypothetical protein
MKFNKFISKIEDLKMVQKYSERINKLCGVEFGEILFLPYQVLKHVFPEMMKEGEYEKMLALLLEIKAVEVGEYGKDQYLAFLKGYKKSSTFKRVKEEDNYDVLKFIFWIQDQYELINEMERRHLSSPPDPKLLAAGIKKLDVLGDVNIIDALAGGDIMKWQEVRWLPYEWVFDKQLKSTIERSIQKQMTPK